MKNLVILMMFFTALFCEDDKRYTSILCEDLHSPIKQVSPFDGVNIEIRTYSYDNDRIRIIYKRDMKVDSTTKNNIYAILLDNENESYSVEIMAGVIKENGDKDIKCQKLKDNIRHYPYLNEAYLIYSKKHNFVFPIVFDKNGGDYLCGYNDDMINYFIRKYIK